MEEYTGKAKCSCGRRAKFRVVSKSQRHFACTEHKSRIENKTPDKEDDGHMTEADYQTWGKL